MKKQNRRMSQYRYDRGFFLMILAIGSLWTKSAIGKLPPHTFAESLPKILTAFANGNPNPLVVSFLKTTAIPNAQLFAYLTLTGEITAALFLITGSLFLLKQVQKRKAHLLLSGGLATGLFLNSIFFCASSWMSAASWSINALMIALQTIGLSVIVFGLIKKGDNNN